MMNFYDPEDGNLYSYNGKTQTITDWSIEYGINYFTLKSRLSMGWHIERALTRPIQTQKVLYEYKGEKLDLKDWSTKLNVPYHTLYSRIYRGQTITQALEKPIRFRSKSESFDKCPLG